MMRLLGLTRFQRERPKQREYRDSRERLVRVAITGDVVEGCSENAARQRSADDLPHDEKYREQAYRRRA